MGSLNEGRGTHPGDTGTHASGLHLRLHRSTKAGARTPATRHPFVGRRDDRLRSTKAGARTPATRSRSRTNHRRYSALNEGRGTHPGDTDSGKRPSFFACSAQRRPGHAPRRHHPTGHRIRPSDAIAQRRPGHAPRRHQWQIRQCRIVLWYAQRRPGHAPRRHGYRLPWRNVRSGPLNEGRGTHPGDTRRNSRHSMAPASAQRRPGHAPRRHADSRRWPRPAGPLNEGRGTHPGDTTMPSRKLGHSNSAQRRPGHAPRRHAPGFAAAAASRSLNEGRGTHPGDTRATGEWP